jgi:hypothetical protein
MGLEGEGRFITYAATMGWHVFKGMSGHEPFDYVIQMDGDLHRVEVKRISSVQKTQRNYYYVTATKMDSKNFDWLFVATDDGDYFIPASECPTQTLSIKQVGGEYERNITAPGKYEVFRV